jgi:integrase
VSKNSSNSNSKRLTYVRGFARYLKNFEAATEVPPTRMFPMEARPRPQIYSEKGVAGLLSAAQRLQPADGLLPQTYYTLIGLLAVSGLRLSEALCLHSENVDLKTGVLTIVKSKFGKSRLVPLHATTLRALANYARQRDNRFPTPQSPFFFVGHVGEQVTSGEASRMFRHLAVQSGLKRMPGQQNSCYHALRHRFAVTTLINWYRSGKDVETVIPSLSTYLGHAHVRDTYWYFSACPELMALAVQRLESHWEGTS